MTKYPAYIKQKAIELRREKHLTVDQIANQLKIAKSTAYEWTKNVPIPRNNSQTAAQRPASERSQAKFKKIRDDAYQQGFDEALKLRQNSLFRDFVTLYIAEAYKRSRNELSVANSDAAVISVCHEWLKHYSSKKIGYSVQSHVDLDDGEVKAYWANVVDIDPNIIKFFCKSNSGKLSGRQ